MRIWSKNHALVMKMNEEHDGVLFVDNFTSDLTDDEFAKMLGAVVPEDDEDGDGEGEDASRGLSDDGNDGRRHLQAGAVNWVTAGKVHPVKDQGECGSCWAFAAVLAQESMQAIKDGTSPVRLSEQQCVECSVDYNGCYGGWMYYCWQHSKDQGMMSNADYPYTAVYTTCMYDSSLTVSHADSWGKCLTPAAAVTQLQSGPLAIAVDANNSCWRFYSSGVLTSADGCPTVLDHAVNIVGYEPGMIIWKKQLVCKWMTWLHYQKSVCLSGY